MAEFNKGDKIRVTDPESGASKTIWLAEDDETGELFTYHGLDPFAPNTELSALLASPYEVTLETPFSEALPTVPGEYEDRIRQAMKVEALEFDPEFEFDEATYKPWVLEEDGTWTAPNGETRPADQNWLLAANGFDFIPWDEREVK
jgi:hypothetical protein